MSERGKQIVRIISIGIRTIIAVGVVFALFDRNWETSTVGLLILILGEVSDIRDRLTK